MLYPVFVQRLADVSEELAAGMHYAKSRKTVSHLYKYSHRLLIEGLEKCQSFTASEICHQKFKISLGRYSVRATPLYAPSPVITGTNSRIQKFYKHANAIGFLLYTNCTRVATGMEGSVNKGMMTSLTSLDSDSAMFRPVVNVRRSWSGVQSTRDTELGLREGI